VRDRQLAELGSSGVGRAGEVLGAALGLGLTSFGGPIAHLGYFERTYVRRRGWLSSDEYAGIVALCQMLPGPTSSQVGFLVGMRRAGWLGGLAAWVGFTLPSALIMFAFAALHGVVSAAVLHGLALVAVVVVGQAVWSMAPRLAPDRTRAAIALGAVVVLLTTQGAVAQVAVLVGGAVAGAVLCRGIAAPTTTPEVVVRGRVGVGALIVGATLLVVFGAAAGGRSLLSFGGIFYRAGALVFGGGHVVLPLLRDALVPRGWMTDGTFLAGYGMAQAVLGPLFTVSAYLGAIAAPTGAAVGWAVTALVCMFFPGMLLALAGVTVWGWLGRRPMAWGALAGVNAAVVGVLGAALYDPIWRSAVRDGRDVAVAVVGLFLLERWRVPPIAIVGIIVVATIASM
jgi:chromate transporter